MSAPGPKLDALMVGTRVAWVVRGRRHAEAHVGVISRFTPKQIVVCDGLGLRYERFWLLGRTLVGAGPFPPVLVHPEDPEVLRLRAHARVRGAVRDVQTLAHAIDTGSIDAIKARYQLGQISKIATAAIRELERLLP